MNILSDIDKEQINEAERIRIKYHFDNIDINNSNSLIDRSYNSNISKQNVNKEIITFADNSNRGIMFKRITPNSVNTKATERDGNLFSAKRKTEINKRNTNFSDNEHLGYSSTKNSVNAILSMIHNNYEDMVEYEAFSSTKTPITNELVNQSETKRSASKGNALSLLLFNRRKVYRFIAKDTSINKNSKSTNAHSSSSFDNCKLSKDKLMSLTDISMYHLLHSMYELYDKIMSLNSPLTDKISLSMNNIFFYVISTFKYSYNGKLELIEYYFKYSQFKKGRSIFPLLDLVIKAKTLLSEWDKCYTLSFSFNMRERHGKEKTYIETIKFDLRKSNECNTWITSEIEDYKGKPTRTCYNKPIPSISEGDFIEFRVNVFNVNGCLCPYSLKWEEMKMRRVAKVEVYDFEKGIMKREKKFDSLRCCELELNVNLWKSCNVLSHKELINDIIEVYANIFKVIEVSYEIAKYFIYKFKMKAYKEGKATRNKYIDYDIEVVHNEDCVCNECSCLGVLNIFKYNKNIQIRKGNVIIFYICDIYK